MRSGKTVLILFVLVSRSNRSDVLRWFDGLVIAQAVVCCCRDEISKEEGWKAIVVVFAVVFSPWNVVRHRKEVRCRRFLCLLLSRS